MFLVIKKGNYAPHKNPQQERYQSF